MQKRHIAIICDMGWKSVRSFIYSGLINSLQEKYDFTIFAYEPNSACFSKLPLNVKVFPLLTDVESTLLRKYRVLARMYHAYFLESKGQKRWYHKIEKPKLNIYRRSWQFIMPFMKLKLLNNIIYNIENKLGYYYGTIQSWERLLRKLKVDAVLSCTNNTRTLPILQTAKNINLKTFIVPLSWKDIFTNPHFNIEPTCLMLWSDLIKNKYLEYNPWLSNANIELISPLYLQPFINYLKPNLKDNFDKKYNLNTERQFICYSMASSKAVINEQKIIILLLEAIKKNEICGYPYLILRINPEEEKDLFTNMLDRYPDILRIQKPEWEWYPEKYWCSPIPEDDELWRMTIYYSAMNISIPSTVTLEFAAVGRPILNICFDLTENIPHEKSNLRFWEADFYYEVREKEIAQPTFNFDELIKKINDILINKDAYDNYMHKLKNNVNWLSNKNMDSFEIVIKKYL